MHGIWCDMQEAILRPRGALIHYTPKHGSWLYIAEIELRVLSSQCLARRIPDKITLKKEVAGW